MSVQFYGYDFEGTGVFHFFRFYAFFLKISFDFGDFETLYIVGKRHWERITCKWVWMNE